MKTHKFTRGFTSVWSWVCRLKGRA